MRMLIRTPDSVTASADVVLQPKSHHMQPHITEQSSVLQRMCVTKLKPHSFLQALMIVWHCTTGRMDDSESVK